MERCVWRFENYSPKALQRFRGLYSRKNYFRRATCGFLLDSLSKKGIDVKDLPTRIRNPIKFRAGGGGMAYGYEATILADICEIVLAARKQDAERSHERGSRIDQQDVVVGAVAALTSSTSC